MAAGLSRKQTKALRMVGTLVALVACLFQAIIAFVSVKAQAWSLNDTGQGLIVLLLLAFILFTMLLATMAILVSPETARGIAVVAVVLDVVVVFLALRAADDATTTSSLIDAGVRLAAPVTLLALCALLVRLEVGRPFR